MAEPRDDLEKYLAECVDIEPTLITEEMVRAPADMAFWGGRHAEAHKRHLLAKLSRDRTTARLRIEVRERLAMQSAKVTESMVESAVEMDPEYHAAKLEEVEAEVEVLRLRNALEAVRAKKDMIVSIGAHIRAEMERDPMVRREHQKSHSVGLEDL